MEQHADATTEGAFDPEAWEAGYDPEEWVDLDGDAPNRSDGDGESGGPLPVLAVVGRPNVGKSTLVNRIIGRREAVVEDTPG